MTGRYILAHDLGTTGNKASLYNSAGGSCASTFQGYATEYARVGWAEQNPEDWWQAVCRCSQELLAVARIDAGEVACVSFSGHMMGCVALDRAGTPLRSAIIWADSRAVDEAKLLVELIGLQEGYQITGHRLSASYSAAKIIWIRKNQPDIYAQVYKFCNAKDFIVTRLTGQFVTDYSDASGTNLYDLQAWDWSDRILNAAEIDRRMLPELCASTTVVGEIYRTPPAKPV